MEQGQGRFHQGASRRRPPLRPGLAPHVCLAHPAGLTLPRQVTPAPDQRSTTLATLRRVREQSTLH
eukprot:1805364-Pleurochrysis_carterae.AAC.1